MTDENPTASYIPEQNNSNQRCNAITALIEIQKPYGGSNEQQTKTIVS